MAGIRLDARTIASPTSRLVAVITATDVETRDQAIETVCRDASLAELRAECAALEEFRRPSTNLYERVRALFFMYALHRFHIPPLLTATDAAALIPHAGYEHLLARRFEEAIDTFLDAQEADGPSDAISSGLAAAYWPSSRNSGAT